MDTLPRLHKTHKTLGIKLASTSGTQPQYANPCVSPHVSFCPGRPSPPHIHDFTRAGRPNQKGTVNSSSMRVDTPVGGELNPTCTHVDWQNATDQLLFNKYTPTSKKIVNAHYNEKRWLEYANSNGIYNSILPILTQHPTLRKHTGFIAQMQLLANKTTAQASHIL